MKKPPVPTAPVKPEKAEPYETTVFKKFPRVTAFLTDRWYDDGESRLPGSLWLDSDLAAFKALLKEPSLRLCVRIRAASLDDLLRACETFLGLESPPWEVDKYAAEQAGKKGKK